MRLHPTHPPPAGKEHSIEKVRSPWSGGRSQPLRAPETFPAPRGNPPRECIPGSVHGEACRTLLTELRRILIRRVGVLHLTGGSAPHSAETARLETSEYPAVGAPRPGQSQDWQHRFMPKGSVSDQVSEDQGLPIAHANEIALTRSFVLGDV